MKYIVSIDQSTSASKAFLVDESGAIVRRASLPHKQYYPMDGRAEHDAEEIWQNVQKILDDVTDGVPMSDIAALSIANQRETTVLWDRKTGRPVCPAIVWQDVRGKNVCDRISQKDADYVLKTTGMALSPYYSASKVRQLMEEKPEIAAMTKNGDIAMGTIESYLIYRMTGTHMGDMSNASRTQLLNLHTLDWDDGLLNLFGIPRHMLPEIRPTDSIFGTWKGAPITGVMGDSHATLFGQGCVTPGSMKVSYGTGSSVMMNIGHTPAISSGDLTTAVAFNYGGKVHYQTEGNITCSCDTLVWLCREMEMFKDADEIERLAGTVENSMGVTLVPALSGLGAPFFDVSARGVISGLSRGATRAHVARAALEGIAHRCADVIEAMTAFCGTTPDFMMADGGGARNALMMQTQADLANCRVRCSAASELSALGAAYMAGIKTGVYKDLDSIPAREAAQKVYVPGMDASTRTKMRAEWQKAISRARI